MQSFPSLFAKKKKNSIISQVIFIEFTQNFIENTNIFYHQILNNNITYNVNYSKTLTKKYATQDYECINTILMYFEYKLFNLFCFFILKFTFSFVMTVDKFNKNTIHVLNSSKLLISSNEFQILSGVKTFTTMGFYFFGKNFSDRLNA